MRDFIEPPSEHWIDHEMEKRSIARQRRFNKAEEAAEARAAEIVAPLDSLAKKLKLEDDEREIVEGALADLRCTLRDEIRDETIKREEER